MAQHHRLVSYAIRLNHITKLQYYLVPHNLTKEVFKMKLLDTSGGNTKLKKNNKDVTIRVAGLSLHPTDTICPMRHIAGCAKSCLISSGRGVFDNVRDSRQAKTDWLMADRVGFITQLCKELVNFEKLCAKTEVVPYVRLNVISDVQWELKAYGAMPDRFPNINFFDYTKMAKRLTKLPRNYELMFSYSKALAYDKQVAMALKTDAPMSVVGIGPMPERYLGKDVVSGDISDIENLKHRNKVLWLTYKVAKGKDVIPEDEIFIVDTRGNTEAFIPTYQVM